MILAIVVMAAAAGVCRAQEPTMEALLGQSLSKLQGNDPEAIVNCIAELKRIEAMFPDEETPKFYIALQSLNYAVMNPHDDRTETLMAEAEERIKQLMELKEVNKVNESNLCTLKGFLYMVRIVQDPAQNGRKYYLDVMENYEKALKLNPDNELAKQLQQKFQEGMRQR
jgi:tetratricopeptide (TPR) repeat protein